MSIDLQKAPEGATHFHYGNVKYSSHWYKEGYFCVVGFEDKGWKKDFDPSPKDQYVELYPQPKPWSGPEDGLPPSSWCSVGNMVQVMSLPTHHHEGVSVYLSKPSKIVASYTDDDGYSFLMLRIDCDFGTGYECFAANRVLPAKTENQITAEKRETAIRELMDIAQVDCRVTAARLVDAGFKREVK